MHEQEKSDVEAAAPTEALADACDHAVALAYEAGRMQQECGMDVLPEEYARGALKFGLVEVRPFTSCLKAQGLWQCCAAAVP